MPRKPSLLHRLTALLRRRPKHAPEIEQALQLIAAIDKGGVPLNPARINQIARNLGLEVSTRAAQEDTIARIRSALDRI
jgi:hypothetical protein